MTTALLRHRLRRFETRFAELGLSVTHQRQVIYGVLAASEEHPDAELVYQRVKERIPTISLATVYKNIKTFVGMGLLQEVGAEAGAYRVDANLERHHHLVCVRCKAVVDFCDERLDRVRAARPNPKNFRILRYQVEALGLCPNCQAGASRGKFKRRTPHGKNSQTSS